MERFEQQCNEIIARNGLAKQKRKFVEECYELMEAITEMQIAPSRKNVEHIVEEMADCMVVWRQFVGYYGIDINEVIDVARKKAERTIMRMNNKNE